MTRSTDAAWEFTHAVSIATDPGAVWPWVVQMGQGRGGFYSFERLQNLLGCQITNTNVILPEYQTLAAGDDFHLHPTAPPLQVAEVVAGNEGGAEGG